jgi:hypothetical protein
MLKLEAAARRMALLMAALACLAVVAACGSAGGSGAPDTVRAASHARTGQARSSQAGSPVAKEVDVKHAGFLNGVSCASAANCTAVGEYYQTARGPERTLIERWDGTAWQVVPSPGDGRDGTLDSVSCPTATSCTAVGSLIMGWNGGTWKVERRSSPFTSVSCTAPGSCTAVGNTAGGEPESGHWNGTSWTVAPMPRPRHPAQSITLAAVSCSGQGFCLAVGDYSYGVRAMPGPGARDRTLAERWNGSSWRVIGSVNVDRWNQLSAVSCTSPRACTAVGSSGSGQFALAERWDGSAWTTQHVPDANRIGYTALAAVSCSTVASCVTVGTYNGGFRAIAETWNGAAWKLQPMPGPPQAEPHVEPATVSCAGPAACVAVGTDGRTLAENLAGTRWRITPTPNP